MFTVAGISTLDGQTKLRFATDFVSRVKILQRNGHTDINLVELPQAMEKADAAAYLSTLPAYAGLEAQVAINEFLGKKTVSKKLDKVEAAVEVAEEVTEAANEAVEETAEDKLAAKRARDAARKREKRALLKAAYEAEILSFPATEAEAV